MPRKSKTVIRRLKNCQLRQRERAKTVTFFISYTLDGTQRQEILASCPKHDAAKRRETLEACEAIARQRDAELDEGVSGAAHITAKRQSFLRFYQFVMESKGNPKAYRNTLLKFQSFLSLQGKSDLTFGELTKALCIDWRNFLFTLAEKGDIQHSTAAKYLETFRAVCNDAIKRELILRNPCAGIEPIPRRSIERQFLTPVELRALASAPLPKCTKYDAQLLADYFLFACYVGARPSDIKALRWQNIQRAPNGSHYLFFEQGKTRQTVVVPLHDAALQILERIKARQVNRESEGKIFVGLPPKSSTNTINNFIRAWLRNAGIEKKITEYCARHSFASCLILSGVQLFEVSRLLGHSTVKHTQVYSHLTAESKQAAVNRLPNIFAAPTPPPTSETPSETPSETQPSQNP